MKKRYFILLATIITMGMVFGIGLEKIQAAKPAPTNNAANANTASTAASTAAAPTSETSETTQTTTHADSAPEEDTSVVGMFGLNWKLFLAQLVNFAIILFVLWKWVFGPVTKGLSDRTEKIENSLQDAQKIAEERQTFDSWKQGEINQVRIEASGILTEAKQTAEKLKQEILEQTKQEQAKLTAATQAKLEQEKQAMVENAKGELAELVIQATQAIIKQKLDPKKDATLISQALKEAEQTKGVTA
jgi:F-type H+-transporting ATPase subunit b